MTVQRMDHVGIVVDDLQAATAFFIELGFKPQGDGRVEGEWVDRIVALDDVQVEFAMVQTPDGHGRLELIKFHAPSGPAGDRHAPANTPGIRHIALEVDDIDATLARLRATARSWSAKWSATATSIGSATSAARMGSSSSWRRRSADEVCRSPLI